MTIDWELVSDEVESFDIYYARIIQKHALGVDLNDERDCINENIWVEIARNVSADDLDKTEVDWELLDIDGQPIKATSTSMLGHLLMFT